MSDLDIEQIKLLIDLFKWFLGGVGVLLLIISRFIWGIYKGLNSIHVTNATRDEKIENLEASHSDLKKLYYQRRN